MNLHDVRVESGDGILKGSTYSAVARLLDSSGSNGK